MALQSAGHRVQRMPGFQPMDPRLFVVPRMDISGGIAQGMEGFDRGRMRLREDEEARRRRMIGDLQLEGAEMEMDQARQAQEFQAAQVQTLGDLLEESRMDGFDGFADPERQRLFDGLEATQRRLGVSSETIPPPGEVQETLRMFAAQTPPELTKITDSTSGVSVFTLDGKVINPNQIIQEGEQEAKNLRNIGGNVYESPSGREFLKVPIGEGETAYIPVTMSAEQLRQLYPGVVRTYPTEGEPEVDVNAAITRFQRLEGLLRRETDPAQINQLRAQMRQIVNQVGSNEMNSRGIFPDDMDLEPYFDPLLLPDDLQVRYAAMRRERNDLEMADIRNAFISGEIDQYRENLAEREARLEIEQRRADLIEEKINLSDPGIWRSIISTERGRRDRIQEIDEELRSLSEELQSLSDEGMPSDDSTDADADIRSETARVAEDFVRGLRGE